MHLNTCNCKYSNFRSSSLIQLGELHCVPKCTQKYASFNLLNYHVFRRFQPSQRFDERSQFTQIGRCIQKGVICHWFVTVLAEGAGKHHRHCGASWSGQQPLGLKEVTERKRLKWWFLCSPPPKKRQEPAYHIIYIYICI